MGHGYRLQIRELFRCKSTSRLIPATPTDISSPPRTNSTSCQKKTHPFRKLNTFFYSINSNHNRSEYSPLSPTPIVSPPSLPDLPTFIPPSRPNWEMSSLLFRLVLEGRGLLEDWLLVSGVFRSVGLGSLVFWISGRCRGDEKR